MDVARFRGNVEVFGGNGLGMEVVWPFVPLPRLADGKLGKAVEKVASYTSSKDVEVGEVIDKDEIGRVTLLEQATGEMVDADRTAYLRVFASVGADVFSSNVVTINQAKYEAPSVATLPFVYDGDGTGNLPDGLAQEGLGVKTYSSSPKMGFDTTGDYLLLQFDERPGVLSYDIKGNGFSEGTFTVQTSADGVTFSTLETYTELGATQSEQFMTLDADVRYIKWIYTEKKNGNVALGNITLAKYVEIPTYTISFDKMTNISVTADDGIFAIEEGDELYEGITVYLTVDPAAGYILDELFVTTVGEVDVETTYISLNRYSFEMPNDDVYIYASAKEDVSTLYTLATSINPGKHYIVVGKNDTEFYAMGKDKGNNRAAVAVRQSGDDGVRVDPEAEVYEFVVSGCSAGYVFYDENEASTGYLYAASSDKNYLKTTNAEVLPDDNAKWTISFGTNGSATIKAQGDKERNLMRFNSSGSNALFACYGSGQQDVYLYVRDGDESSEPESFYKTITDAGWATLCLPFTAETPEGVTAYAVTGVDDSVLEKEEIEDGVPASTGVLLKGDAGMVKFVKNDGLKLHVPEGNCLVGTTEGATFEGDELGGTYCYILANDESKGIGFYWQKGTGGTSAHCEPYKAVLELHFKGAPEAIGFRLDDATMVEAVKAMEENAVIYDLTADDIFVIVAKKGTDYYAMSNDGGTQNPPSAVSVTMTEGIITSNVEDRIKWNLESNSSGRYTFLVNGSTTKWLYCTNSNNGVRVGTGSVAVHTTAERFHAVVEVDSAEVLEADDIAELAPDGIVVILQVVAGGKGVAGVDADADAALVLHLINNLGEVVERVAHVAPLSGGVLDDGGNALRLVEGDVDALGNTVEALVVADFT